jgi:hypothetical protein
MRPVAGEEIFTASSAVTKPTHRALIPRPGSKSGGQEAKSGGHRALTVRCRS